MSIITPEQIKEKASNLYAGYLRAWVRGEGEGFFPRAVPANLAANKSDLPGTIRAFALLDEKAKATRGWGYSVEKQQVDSPDGHGPRPKRIWIETEDDLLRLAGKAKEFADIQYVAERLRSELPGVEKWVVDTVLRLGRHRQVLDELIAVAKYLTTHPMPGCYLQQLPVEVDTKFISKHDAVLKAWLNRLLPASSIVSHEKNFARRFGFRERQSFRGVWLLDEAIQHEFGLPFAEFAVPIRSLSQLAIDDVTIVVVENKAMPMSVPHAPRTVVVTGDGASAPALATVPWMRHNRLIYWGDIDAAGYAILSQLRTRLPHVESVLMDVETFEMHKRFACRGPTVARQAVPALTESELQMYEHCQSENVMLEQEKLRQSHVHARFVDAFSLDDA